MNNALTRTQGNLFDEAQNVLSLISLPQKIEKLIYVINFIFYSILFGVLLAATYQVAIPVTIVNLMNIVFPAIVFTSAIIFGQLILDGMKITISLTRVIFTLISSLISLMNPPRKLTNLGDILKVNQVTSPTV